MEKSENCKETEVSTAAKWESCKIDTQTFRKVQHLTLDDYQVIYVKYSLPHHANLLWY